MTLEQFKTALKSKKSYADTDLQGGYFVAVGDKELTAICETIKESEPNSRQLDNGDWVVDYDEFIDVISYTVEDADSNTVEIEQDDECLEILTEIIERTL